MDQIIIGKESLKSNGKPFVIYCGQSSAEARDAVAATGGKFPWIYQVNPFPIRNFKSTDWKPTETATATPEPAPVVVTEPETESPKKKKSK